MSLVSHLTARDFRNLQAVELRPGPRFNVLEGANGEGKTNLLEALFLVSTLKPLRATRPAELIRWQQGRARVEAEVIADGLSHRLAVELKEGERVAEREGKRARASEYFGPLRVVLFTPEDVGLIREAPVERRKFLDRAVFTGRPAFLEDALAYRRALDARNRLLRDGAPDPLLDAYEAALAPCGARVASARAEYLAAFAPRFAAIFASIAGDGLHASVAYRPGFEWAEDLEGSLCRTWALERARDRQRGFTQHGPHADDLGFKLMGRAARLHASQGQQRALVLALKIAEVELIEAQAGELPVLLLDDVSSELDRGRNARLFEFLDRFQGQVFITTTDAAFLQIGGASTRFFVQSGRIEQLLEGG